MNVRNNFGNVLIIGAGPAGINIAVNIKPFTNKLGLFNRKSGHGISLKTELENRNNIIKSLMKNKDDSKVCNEAKIDFFYDDYKEIDDIWDTIVLSIPSDSYLNLLEKLKLKDRKKLKTIILVSPSIGSNLNINKKILDYENDIEVISFSNYYGATKFDNDGKDITIAFTRALKKKIYVGSNKVTEGKSNVIRDFINSLHIECEVLKSPLEAEIRNITTYVHPPFFLNAVSLSQILGKDKLPKYMYKIYPEGPINRRAIKNMVLLWKEISTVVRTLNKEPINLLKFLNDDNYPVHNETLSRYEIENFSKFDQIKQEYLLYIRYSAILIDPFSEPNEKGRYFDFSAVPYKKIYKDNEGKWVMPRIPLEDYKRLKDIYILGKEIEVDMPITLSLIKVFENNMAEFINENRCEFSNYKAKTS